MERAKIIEDLIKEQGIVYARSHKNVIYHIQVFILY